VAEREPPVDVAALPQAVVEPPRRSRVSLVWLVPLVALAIAGWLAWHTLSQRGPTVAILFQDAEGIEAAFLYPSLGLLVGAISDPALATSACIAYNRWLADYCAKYPD
jgi:hypothetical protein